MGSDFSNRGCNPRIGKYKKDSSLKGSHSGGMLTFYVRPRWGRLFLASFIHGSMTRGY